MRPSRIREPTRRFRRSAEGGFVRRTDSFWVSCSVLIVPLALGACRGHEPLRRLPLEGAQMITVGNEARPSRRIPDGDQVTWAIPASSGGRLEIACAIAQDDP